LDRAPDNRIWIFGWTGNADQVAVSSRATPERPYEYRVFPDGVETAIFGMGCFWGAERVFWEAPGVYTTAVGYAGGFTPNPTYEEVCSGRTGHTEAVLVAFTLEQARSRVEYVIAADYRVSTGDLYKAYNHFCEQNGEYLRSHRRLSQNMLERGFKQLNSGGRYWDGVKLIDGN
ncbi:hypothetical protein B4Q13_19970, partial [Lacticaseibacillus rhamnosus]